MLRSAMNSLLIGGSSINYQIVGEFMKALQSKPWSDMVLVAEVLIYTRCTGYNSRSNVGTLFDIDMICVTPAP
jgi:hypothetical protein